MPAIRRVLIANRGEIAVRVIRTCRRLGIESVLAVSDADANAVPARMADRTIRIGPGGLAETYLRLHRLGDATAAIHRTVDLRHRRHHSGGHRRRGRLVRYTKGRQNGSHRCITGGVSRTSIDAPNSGTRR